MYTVYRERTSMAEVPGVEAADAVRKLDGVVPAESVQAVYRAKLAHGAVRLCGIPFYRSFEICRIGYGLCKLLYCELFTGADIDVRIAYVSLAL